MKVLSLFDGMSCGQITLNRIGLKPEKYFASEVDKNSISITQKNFPNTKQLGSVTELHYYNGYLTTKNKIIKAGKIDLLIGGSPCQNFSFSGNRNGMVTEENIEITDLNTYLKMKKEGFKFKGESFLFWEYIRLLKEIRLFNPEVKFLLENVRMSKKWSSIINKQLETEFVFINSSLVSAQNRPRLYWTNIENIRIPEDKKLVIKDILDKNKKNHTLIKDTSFFKSKTKLTKELKIEVLERNYKKNNTRTDTCKLVSDIKNDTPSKLSRQGDRVYSILGKSPCLTTSGIIIIDNGNENKNTWRRLSPLEKERLQTVPDNYTEGVTENQRSKMLGNGWTVDVIVEFFKPLLEKFK